MDLLHPKSRESLNQVLPAIEAVLVSPRHAALSPPHSSMLHLRFSSLLSKAGLAVSNEYTVAPTVFVDIHCTVRNADRGVVVEVDGPSHYFADSPREPTPATLFKRRLLEALDWRVVSVPYWDLDNDREQEWVHKIQELLRN